MFLNSPPQTRVEAFDELIGVTDLVLRHPFVQQALGPLAVELAAINDNAFLPNITDGIICVPSSRQNTNNTAVVPAIYQIYRPGILRPKKYEPVDVRFSLDDSACLPTIQKKRSVFDRLVSLGWSEENAEDFIVSSLVHPRSRYWLAIPTPGYAGVHCKTLTETDVPAVMTSRPIVTTNFMPGTLHPIEKAFSMIHEYVHVQGIESDCSHPVDPVLRAVAEESEAYHIETEARLAMMAAGFRAWNKKDEEHAFRVEYARREHTTIDDPYATPPSLVQDYQKMKILTF